MDRNSTEIPAERVTTTRPEERLTGDELREIVGSYETYREAQKAVDHLSDQDFDVKSISIVAEGLSYVEEVTGRLSWGRAMLAGLGNGALLGAFIGFIFGIFNFFDPIASALSLAFYGLIFGGVIGGIIGLLAYLFSGGQRDFTSVGSVKANRYEVTAHPNVAQEARDLLRGMH